MVYDFSKTIGDTVSVTYDSSDTTIVMVLDDFYASVFGSVRRIWSFYSRTLPGTVYSIEHVADGIGMIRFEVEGGEAWRLRGAIIGGSTSGILEVQTQPTSSSVVIQNYPNPFNTSTVIQFHRQVGETGLYRIVDMKGSTFQSGVVEQDGNNIIVWNAHDAASGVYYLMISFGRDLISHRMMVVK